MKKLIMAAVAAIALVGSAFAVEIQADAAVTLPLTFGKFTSNGISSEEKITAVGLDLGADVFFTDLIGVGAKMNFALPLTMKEGNSDKIKFFHDYDGMKYTGFQFNTLVGCAIRPLNNDKMFLIITPGIDINLVSYKATIEGYGSTKFTQSSFGLGADAQFGYKFNDKIAISGGCLLAYNFFGSFKVEGEKIDGMKVSGFFLTPKVGATYFF